MIKFKRILFPTDFSPAAVHALDYAISLALEHEATLVLVHVIEDIGFASPFTLSSFPVNLEYQHGMDVHAKAELHKAVAPQLKRQLEVQERLAQGKPFVEIGRIAKEEAVDLIQARSQTHTSRLNRGTCGALGTMSGLGRSASG